MSEKKTNEENKTLYVSEKHAIKFVDEKSNLEKVLEKLCLMHDIYYCKNCNDYTDHYRKYRADDTFHMGSYLDGVYCTRCDTKREEINPLE